MTHSNVNNEGKHNTFYNSLRVRSPFVLTYQHPSLHIRQKFINLSLPCKYSRSKASGAPSVELRLCTSSPLNGSVTLKGANPSSDWMNSSISCSLSSKNASIFRSLIVRNIKVWDVLDSLHCIKTSNTVPVSKGGKCIYSESVDLRFSLAMITTHARDKRWQ